MSQNNPDIIEYEGWPKKGYPLLRHKKKIVNVYESLKEAVNTRSLLNQQQTRAGQEQTESDTEKALPIETILGEFADIISSKMRFIQPITLKAEEKFYFNCHNPENNFGISAEQEYYIYYHGPYLMIVGDGETMCEIDLFYSRRPLPFSLDKKPEFEWWVELYEFKSFKRGWAIVDDQNFFIQKNPRYLKNFNNRQGVTADYDTVAIYQQKNNNKILGYYTERGEYDALKETYKKNCIFLFEGLKDELDSNIYNIEALDLNPLFVGQSVKNTGKLRFGWRGDSSTVIIQLDKDFEECQEELSVSEEPRYFKETKKTQPAGFGILIKRNVSLKSENDFNFSPKDPKIFRNTPKASRNDEILSYSSSDQFKKKYDKTVAMSLNKWDFLHIYEIKNGWARVQDKFNKKNGWIRLENMIFNTQYQGFPKIDKIAEYVDEQDLAPE